MQKNIQTHVFWCITKKTQFVCCTYQRCSDSCKNVYIRNNRDAGEPKFICEVTNSIFDQTLEWIKVNRSKIRIFYINMSDIE